MVISAHVLANKRLLKRHKLSAEILLFDQLSNTSIGKLVDIHQEGILLLGQGLGIKSSHQITVTLPNQVNLQREFMIGIECLWTQPADEEHSLYWTGCSIIDKSDLASDCIASLINMTS